MLLFIGPAYTMTAREEELALLQFRLRNHLDEREECVPILEEINAKASSIEKEEILKSVACSALQGTRSEWSAQRILEIGARVDFETHPPRFPHMFDYGQVPAAHLVADHFGGVPIKKAIDILKQCPGFDLYAINPLTGQMAMEMFWEQLLRAKANDRLAYPMFVAQLPHLL